MCEAAKSGTPLAGLLFDLAPFAQGAGIPRFEVVQIFYNNTGAGSYGLEIEVIVTNFVLDSLVAR